jgi:hypothetical protein
MTVRLRFALILAAWGVSAALAAQPTCSLTGEHLISWPDDNPVWQMCWLRPADSSGISGSGLEVRNVYYNGHLVMKRGHVPILNVKYETGCGGSDFCYRDWQDQQDNFIADNIVTPHVYAEPTLPPVDVCDQHQGHDVCQSGDTNCFDGVAAEKRSDHLTLTTQFEAGWYRYEMKWTFWEDGRIQPEFGFSAVTDPCTNFNHRHHAYWRFDFDIDDAANDVVTEGPNPGPGGGRSGARQPIVVLSTEAMRLASYPGITWSVIDSVSRRGYRIVPGAEAELPADSFSVADFWCFNYHANQIDDSGQSGPACATHINGFLNGETMTDVVVWYRTGVFHAGGVLVDCPRVGPTLYPVGDWSP